MQSLYQFKLSKRRGPLGCIPVVFVVILLQYLSCQTDPVSSSYKEEKLSEQTFAYHQSDHLKQGAGLFDSLTYSTSTDESKLRLALLVDDKIDINKDGLVQLDELVSWLRQCQDNYAQHDVDRQWISYGRLSNLDDRALNWEEYIEREYDHLISLTKQSESKEQIQRIKDSYNTLLKKDKRRWKLADLNSDTRLSKDEFKDFLYPEHSDRMHGVVVEEKFELIDKDNDGRISIEEHLADLAIEEAHHDHKSRDDAIKEEKFKFINQLDINKDSYLDMSEMAIYISKSEIHDHSIAEAQHLMQSADANRDHRLTKEEILAAYHEFVNSHATDFGEALKNPNKLSHDEL